MKKLIVYVRCRIAMRRARRLMDRLQRNEARIRLAKKLLRQCQEQDAKSVKII